MRAGEATLEEAAVEEVAPARPIDRVRIGGRWATVWATSTLASAGRAYAPPMAFDRNPETAWVEGVEGVGARAGSVPGETLTLQFDQPVGLEGVGFVLGYAKSERLFVRNSAPTRIALTTDGQRDVFEVAYVKDAVAEGTRFADVDVSDDRPDGCYHTSSPLNFDARRVVVFGETREVRRLSVEIVEAAAGTHYLDTGVSEVVPLLEGSDFATGPVAVLSAMRSRGGVDALLLPSASVQDLRDVYLTPGMGPVPGRGATASRITVENSDGYDVVAWARVPSEERLRGQSPESLFMRYTRPTLVGTLVTVLGPPGAERIVGARSFHRGDCEWVESYPDVRLEDGRVIGLRERVTGDGCPGCSWRLLGNE